MFYTRRFSLDDIDVYKAIRLEALLNDPGMYGNSYAMEVVLPEEEWADRIANPRFARFGLYDNTSLIGITGIVIDKDKPGEAYMTQSYIRNAYRGQHLSRLLYDARIAWAKEQGVKRLIIGHRESNAASKAANQRYGFTFTHREANTWPDGAAEDMLYYELSL